MGETVLRRTLLAVLSPRERREGKGEGSLRVATPMTGPLAYLTAMVRSAQAALAARETDLRHRDLLIEKLRHQLAGLRRQRYGVSAELLDQLELALEDEELARATVAHSAPRAAKSTPRRRALPGHLPREETVLHPNEHCADCGGALKRLGEDVTEELE